MNKIGSLNINERYVVYGGPYGEIPSPCFESRIYKKNQDDSQTENTIIYIYIYGIRRGSEYIFTL